MSQQKNSNSLGPLMIIGVLFFVFGFITWLNGTLIAFFKKAFNLDNQSSLWVTFAFFISYFVMAIPTSYVLKFTGFKKGMSLGLGIMGIGALIFIPAANAVSYPLFLVGLFTIGIGLTVLQTASNPYVTILGPRESAAQRISFMGIANKLAGIVSQKIFGGLLLTGGAVAAAQLTPAQELDKVVTPYMIMAGILIFLAITILFMKGLPEVSEEQDDIDHDLMSSRTSVFQFPSLVFGLVALFAFVGVEVIIGDTIINYGITLGFEENQAKDFGTYTLWSMMAGYILGIVLIPKYVSQQKWLTFSAILGILMTVLALLTSGMTSVLCIALLGLPSAVMWPAIWPLALDKLGKFTKIGSAFLIMMIAGGAILPLVYGTIADATNTQTGYSLLILLYGYILYYALIGHKKKEW